MSFVEIMTQAGIVSSAQVAELRRWGLPATPVDGDLPPPPEDYTVPVGVASSEEPLSPAEGARALLALRFGLEQLLQDPELVLVRITDPNLLPQFLATRERGVLHVRDGELEADFEITFGRMQRGEFIFPWSSQALEEAFERGDVWLTSPKEVYFSASNVFCYGTEKTFVVCSPAESIV